MHLYKKPCKFYGVFYLGLATFSAKPINSSGHLLQLLAPPHKALRLRGFRCCPAALQQLNIYSAREIENNADKKTNTPAK